MATALFLYIYGHFIAGQRVLTGHPAYLPRTSSPGAADSQDRDEILGLNQTHPLPTSHPPAQVLDSGNPNYSLHNAADLKVPLRYTIWCEAHFI